MNSSSNVGGDVVMDVDKSADKSVVSEDGEEVTFTFTVSNTGDVAFEITALDDSVYGTLSGDADCQVGTVLAPGGSCDFQQTFTVEPEAGTSEDHVNTFEACSILSSELGRMHLPITI